MIHLHLRARKPLVGSSSPARIGREIRRGCQFIQGLFRSLGHLLGGLARFVPCQPSAHFTRLLHLGWGQCGHGLSCRPREWCDMQVTQLWVFLGYPNGAATELCNGTLKLGYSSTPSVLLRFLANCQRPSDGKGCSLKDLGCSVCPTAETVAA